MLTGGKAEGGSDANGATGAGGSVVIKGGIGTNTVGGAVTVTSGVGTSTDSGAVTIATADFWLCRC